MSFRECTAKSKRTKKQCGARAMNGKNVCYHHGGKSLSGISSPSTKHGRYSKDLPTQLAGRYKEAQSDPELLSLRSEIALIDVRIGGLVKTIDSEKSERLWGTVKKEYDDLAFAMKNNNTSQTIKQMGEIKRLLSEGMEDDAIWEEITGAIDQRRKLVESERTRLVQMQEMITSERAMLLIAAVVDIVRENVNDAKTLQSISADIGRLITVDAS